jgi:hypothetical protein
MARRSSMQGFQPWLGLRVASGLASARVAICGWPSSQNRPCDGFLLF